MLITMRLAPMMMNAISCSGDRNSSDICTTPLHPLYVHRAETYAGPSPLKGTFLNGYSKLLWIVSVDSLRAIIMKMTSRDMSTALSITNTKTTRLASFTVKQFAIVAILTPRTARSFMTIVESSFDVGSLLGEIPALK